MVLIVLWGAWCFLHSFMISLAVTGFVRKHLKKAYRYYRVFYNVMAVVSLIPVCVYSFSITGQPVFRWEGPLRIVQGLLMASAFLLFIGGARRYDMAKFLGIGQIREKSTCRVLKEDCRVDTGGILGMVRHPWYAGGILVVWARNLASKALREKDYGLALKIQRELVSDLQSLGYLPRSAEQFHVQIGNFVDLVQLATKKVDAEVIEPRANNKKQLPSAPDKGNHTRKKTKQRKRKPKAS